MKDIIEPLVRSHLAVHELRHGSAIEDVDAPTASRKPATLEDVERAHILRTLKYLNWVIEGPRGAADALGLNASTLRNRMRKLDIRREDARISEASA